MTADNNTRNGRTLNHAVKGSGQGASARNWLSAWGKTDKRTMTESNLMPIQTPLTRQTLEQMFIQVDSDPLAGKGCLSKKDILIDRIIAHCRVSVVQPAPVDPAPLLLETKDQAK